MGRSPSELNERLVLSKTNRLVFNTIRNVPPIGMELILYILSNNELIGMNE